MNLSFVIEIERFNIWQFGCDIIYKINRSFKMEYNDFKPIPLDFHPIIMSQPS